MIIVKINPERVKIVIEYFLELSCVPFENFEVASNLACKKISFMELNIEQAFVKISYNRPRRACQTTHLRICFKTVCAFLSSIIP